jgi:hypothetical protein
MEAELRRQTPGYDVWDCYHLARRGFPQSSVTCPRLASLRSVGFHFGSFLCPPRLCNGLILVSYPVTRDYPYKWFKWLVLFGGIFMIVVSSILNFSANGYSLAVKYTTYPNETSAEKSWIQSFSLDGKKVSSCEPHNLQVNTQYYTDKLSLVYTLSNIWQVQSDGRIRTLPSLPYTYNPLVHCTVPLVVLDLRQSDGRSASEMGWTPWGLDAVVSRIQAPKHSFAPLLIITGTIGFGHMLYLQSRWSSTAQPYC